MRTNFWLMAVAVSVTVSMTGGLAIGGVQDRNPLDTAPAAPVVPGDDNPLDRKGAAAAAPVAAPAPAGPPIVLAAMKPYEIKDYTMQGVCSHTIIAPGDWVVSGGVIWRGAEWAQPQLKVRAEAADGSAVQLLPQMPFAYVVLSPQWMREMEQSGLSPAGFKEKDGTPPPEDLGVFLAENYPKWDETVTECRVIDQKRDEAGEATMAKLAPAGTDNPKMYVITLGYTRKGVKIRERIRVTKQVMPPQESTASTLTAWYLFMSSVAAPADKFDRMQPALEAILGSVRAKPQWLYCKNIALQRLDALRNQQSRDLAARFTEVIAECGGNYGREEAPTPVNAPIEPNPNLGRP